MNKSCVGTALMALVMLAGCAELPESLGGAPKRPPKYVASKVLRFEDWFNEPGSCLLSGNSVEVKTTTNGHLDTQDGSEGIELRLVFTAPLAGRPRASFSTYAIPLRLDGQGQAYTLHIPYTPVSVAHYQQPDNYLTIAFQGAAHGGEDMEVSFSTTGLVAGVTYLSRACK